MLGRKERSTVYAVELFSLASDEMRRSPHPRPLTVKGRGDDAMPFFADSRVYLT